MKWILYGALGGLLLLMGGGLYAQTDARFTISGYVSDAETGERLVAAKVVDPSSQIGAISNAYGFYSLTLPADSVRLVASYVGYQPWARTFFLEEDLTLDIQLTEEALELETVQITSEELQTLQEDANMSSIQVPIEQIKKLPALMGDPDVIKAVQLLPGVQSGAEGLSGLYVRGGGPDQNLILLDGVPLYNVTHLGGLFSVFNTDALNRVNLVKGGFPARYGGRLSSVLDITMKEGNSQEFHGSAQVGLLAAKVSLEGPIVKDKTSFFLSARRTYFDLWASPIIRAATEDNSGGYFFHDFNAKINHKFSDKDRIYFSFFNSLDRFRLETLDQFSRFDSTTSQTTRFEQRFETGFGWGNTVGALRWNHLFSNRLFGNFTATFSRYDFDINTSVEDLETTEGDPTMRRLVAFAYESGIRDYSLRTDFDFFLNPNHLIRFGGYLTHHKFSPGNTLLQYDLPSLVLDTSIGNPTIFSTEAAAYLEDEVRVSSRIKLNIGLHLSGLKVRDKFFPSLQPRFSGRYLLPNEWALKASYSGMQQYIHLLSNSGVGLPLDLWVPATDRVPPQFAHQGAVGVARTFSEIGVDVSVEAYYKSLTNVVEYLPGASFFDLEGDWENLVTSGRGESYGVEFLVQKKTGRLSGWVGYTLSRSNRQFEDLNRGEVFPYKYDRRHDLSIVSSYEINDRIDLSATFVYGTGNTATVPVGLIWAQNISLTDQFSRLFLTNEFGPRNGFRLRPYHRVDLGANFHKQKKRVSRTWTVSIYNLYNRQNPYFVYFAEMSSGSPEFRQVSLFPIIPSFSWRIEW